MQMIRTWCCVVLAMAVLAAGCASVTETTTETPTSEPSYAVIDEMPTPEADFTKAELAFVDRAIALEDLIAESSDLFATGDILNEEGVDAVGRGLEQWNDEWSDSECPSPRLSSLYEATVQLSSMWFDCCQMTARYVTGDATDAELTAVVEDVQEAQDAVLAELEDLEP